MKTLGIFITLILLLFNIIADESTTNKNPLVNTNVNTKELEKLKESLYKKFKNRKDKLLIEILNTMKDSQDIKFQKKIILEEFIKENPTYIDKVYNKGITPLFYAVVFGNFDAVKLLVENGANILHRDKNNKTAYQYIDKIKDETIRSEISLYFKNKYSEMRENIDQQKLSNFNDLIKGIKEFKQLNKINQDIKIKEVVNAINGGTYAIIEAAFLNQERVVNDLVKRYKADINVQDEKGYTALMLAAYCECEKMVKLLLKLKADINIQNKEGLSAIFVAGNEKIFKLLLKERNLNINLQDNKGNSLLHYAAKANDYKFVKDLLRKKADKTLINEEGKKAMELATEKKVVKALK